MRPRVLLGVLALGIALLAGGALIALSGGDGEGDTGDRARPTRSGQGDEARAIRGWSAALNAGDFDRAAGYFARGAIVDQGRRIRLADRRAAEAFVRSLPCRGQVTAVRDEGETFLASFRLLEGRGGGCAQGGTARVRIRFSGGKFLEWRQLPTPAAPEGQIA